MSNNSRSSAAKVVPRSLRSETRNRAKEELKRVINALDKVRKWERRWVVLKDSSINVYKWVPVTGQSMITTMKQTVKPLVTVGEETNQSTISAENSNDETNVTAVSRTNFNEDSNAAFSEVGFDSDSNQTGTFDRVDYKQSGDSAVDGGVCSGGGKQTDFSQMVAEEAANSRQRDADSGGGSSNQSSPLPQSRRRAADSPSRATSSRKSSKH